MDTKPTRLRLVDAADTGCGVTNPPSVMHTESSAPALVKSSENISEISEIWSGVDAIVDDWLSHHRDAEGSEEALVSAEVVRKWRSNGVSRPRTANLFAIARRDHRVKAAIIKLIGGDMNCTPEERIALDIMREAARRAVAKESEP